ncbi:MAG: thrombospondin type 3 repeat-containing protein [Planctomycetes bacterium]|nr:thrombospondin type 3 repeat-containing protein [Planctomycetota bacterium]
MQLVTLQGIRRWALVFAIPTLVLALLTGCPGEPPPPQPLDSDGDGVVNGSDQCADTPTGTTVDEVGCPVTDPPADSDGDGVADDADTCPDTPAGTDVDAVGCPVDTPPADSDGDGVNDEDDDCPNTLAGVQVDEAGCPLVVPVDDSDGDGVGDDDDDCPDTPTGTQVDATGCPVVTTEDSDSDGVNDDADDCPDTPAGTQVDATGCPVNPTEDADGDGVANQDDDCSNTPAGATVDDNGCAASQRDTDDDGVKDDVDLCPGTAAGETVDRTGCSTSGPPPTGAVCGNGVVETGEQCDPPNGSTCDANCQTVSAGGLANDSCDSPTTVTEGTRSFSTVGATTDGPTACLAFGFNQIDSDIWYCYVPTCTDVVVVSLCGSLYDTKLAVYDGCDCPVAGDAWLGCSDDSCGKGQESRVEFAALAGQQYLIRVGGYLGKGQEEGEGTLTIFCRSDLDQGANACGAGAGNCFSDNGTPGCEDSELCGKVCAVDMFCCDTKWDTLCATKADGITNGFDACGEGSGDCFAEDGNGTVGCDSVDCCQAVCEQDPYCCLKEWDFQCAEAVPDACGLHEGCFGARGICSAEHPEPGCSNFDCCNSVCDIDPACCDTTWDDVCVGHAATVCTP